MRQGETFQQITAPYRETAARILEKAPDQIDMVGGGFNKAFMHNPDGKGERQMSISEFSDYLRTDRKFGYEYTTAAKSSAYQIANTLAQMFGRA